MLNYLNTEIMVYIENKIARKHVVKQNEYNIKIQVVHKNILNFATPLYKSAVGLQ